MCAETYPNIECIVVDDAGTFDLSGVAASRPVRVVRRGRSGVAGARNAGLAATTGEFCIFLDDDDVALPERISTLMDVASRHGADMAFGQTRRVSPWPAVALPAVPTGAVPSDCIGLCDLITCAPHVNAVLVRTSALRAVGGFDMQTSHFDDWSAWLRLADRNARICSTRSAVAEWRLHDAGLSGELLQIRAMKTRILALFDHLSKQLTSDGARAIAVARRIVAGVEIETYDDYAEAMAIAQQTFHATGHCFGPRVRSHATRRAPRAALAHSRH